MTSSAIEPSPQLERLIFFSDAVFAIAITLLVIEIKVPHLPHSASTVEHIQALLHLIPNFIGFFVSFAVIGAFWAGHHRAFGLARHYAPGLVLPNLAMLCAIAFTPFATAYMSENFGELMPHVFYNSVLLITALLNIRLVRRVTSAPYVDEAVSVAEIRYTRLRGWGVVGGSALALVLSFFVPQLSQFALTTVPLWQRLALRLAKAD